MKHFLFLKAILILLLISSCSSDAAVNEVEQVESEYPNSHLLVEARELLQQLDEENLLLIDAREGRPDSLIPGAIRFPAVQELGDPDHPVSNFLIGPTDFKRKMRVIGLDSDDKVIIYDGGNNLAAARLFYALENYGFTNAALLNGGFSAWKEAEYPVSTVAGTPEKGTFSIPRDRQRVYCDFEYVAEATNDPDKIVFDVRSPGEYTGEIKRAEKAGHIPNAVHLEWRNVLQEEGIPTFLPADEISRKYRSVGITPDKEVIPHCQTNVRGAHAYFTLRLMGYDSVRPYEASWAEYGNREDSVVQ